MNGNILPECLLLVSGEQELLVVVFRHFSVCLKFGDFFYVRPETFDNYKIQKYCAIT